MLGIFTCATIGRYALAADDAFFREKIAPIFERNCVSCHQGDKPKGGLSLVTANQALAGGESGVLIEPGRPGDSLLIEQIEGDKPAMPKAGKPLAAQQVADIRLWIEQGAAWPADLTLRDRKLAGADDNWWSLRPLVRPAVPEVNSAWVQSPIDAFIWTKLHELGLAPAPQADRRTLIRRLTYDLHGLPPTPDEVAAFLADESTDAYEKLIDRLLDSPRYGERWGRHWLDIVHFGESHGYDKDKPRPNAWPYRDYVINAFNSDEPYWQFIEQQLAGDVLYPDDPQAIVATGFIAAGPWDFVGHVELAEGTLDKKITRSNDRDDMVATAMSTFQSLTVHCARCHNHKFDPIPQEDYYRLQAVFAGVDRADRPFDVDSRTQQKRRELTVARAPLAARQQALADLVGQISSPEIRELDARLTEFNRDLAALPKATEGAVSPSNGYHSGIEPKADVTKWVQIDLGQSLPIVRIVLVPARPVDFADTPGFGFPARFRVETSDDAEFDTAHMVRDAGDADFANPGDMPVVIDLKNVTARYVRVTATKLWPRSNDYVFALSELQALSGKDESNVAFGAKVTALDSIEGGLWGTRNLVDGFSSRTRIGDAKELAAALVRRDTFQKSIARLTASRQSLVDARLDEPTRSEIRTVKADLAQVDEQLAALPQPLLIYAAAHSFTPIGTLNPPAQPRPVYLLNRGSDKTPGPEVTPGALSCVGTLAADLRIENPQDESARRAALARWIADPQNPLTRRSIVNRLWQYHFGRGIVDTPNDFGHMGALPTHPELLDWLAVELAEPSSSPALGSQRNATPPGPPLLRGREAWSLKRMHKLILMSAVYRQSSGDNAKYAAIDSGNQFLWRQNRQRLEAEAIRDAVLAVGGKLDTTMGGPSVQQFLFKDDHSPIYDYEQFDVDAPAANRRSVYRFIVRSVPDPFFECLDAADPSLLTPKRNATLTALQALSLLNNPFMVRQADHFAQRLRGLADDPAGQVEAAYRIALSRPPRPDETAILTRYIHEHGLSNACRVILNSNEFVFVD
ncbi:MAG: DUF1553 domain-containing protein [Planctomycetaceae bacterium]|nr:DUF1553 domain-containing protein [Planctomycetaceae bacterium]